MVRGQGIFGLNLMRIISNEKAPAAWRERKKREYRRRCECIFFVKILELYSLYI